MTWRQAMSDAVAFILEQSNMDERAAEYIARTVLRMGEQLAKRESSYGGNWRDR